MKNAPALHAVEYAVFQCLHGIVRLLPHTAARRLGRALGRLAYRLLGGRRRRALDNLAQALPELGADERETIARGAFASMTSHATELLSWQRFDAVEFCRRLTLEDWHHVTETLARSPSAFFMTAHFGPWEVLGAVTGLYTPPTQALVRPLDNPYLERFLSRCRCRFGMGLIRKQGAARRLVRSLDSGGRLLVLLDQRVRPREAVEVPFFGRPASTPKLIARLAVKHQVPVVPLFVYPAPGGRYRVVARRPLSARDGADPVRELTARCTAVVEAEVRRRPELWLWMHDRWKPQ